MTVSVKHNDLEGKGESLALSPQPCSDCILFESDMSPENMEMKYAKLVDCVFFPASEQHRLYAYDGNQYMKRNQSVNMFLFFSTSVYFKKAKRNTSASHN